MQVHPATLDRFDDVQDLLNASGEAGCWCQAWRGFDARGGPSRPELLREQMQSAPPPGYLAYSEGLGVGWVGIGVRTQTPRLRRSKTIPWIDDQPYWVIGCFRTRPGHRRRGIAGALLQAVVQEAATAGAPGVEAYPIDPAGGRVNTSQAFVGLASMFDAAGFRRVTDTKATSASLPRILVRLDFTEEH